MLGADAEIESLKDELATTKTDLKTAKVEAAAQRVAEEHLRATHAAELARETVIAADKLAQVQAIVRSRDEKIATMQASFSWPADAARDTAPRWCPDIRPPGCI